LNNLTVKEPNENTDSDGKLTTEIKKKIIEVGKTADGQFGLTQIVKLIGTKKEHIKGFRVNKSDKAIIHTLSGYRKFRKTLAEVEIEANYLPIEFFDKVADILTLNSEKSEVRKQLEKNDFEFKNIENFDKIKDIIIEQNKDLLVDGRATWHGFSYKTLNMLIPELENTSEEQMSILTHLGYMKPDNEKYKGKGLKNIPSKSITDEIYNPVVAKSVREAINVFNAISKRVGAENIEHVVIELPRDDNADDEKRKLQKFQKEQETEKSKADDEILQKLLISSEALKAEYRKKKKLSIKVRFWYQQECLCPYCGKNIEAKDLIYQNDSFEIDHIIPISVSFDDSQNNKVLVHTSCNQAKEKQTPIGWINNGGGFGQPVTEYKAKVLANKHYNKAKKDNLLSEVDLNNLEVRQGFIARNLNDTRYASRVVLNEFYAFFKSYNLPTKVKVVRGKWTSQMRKKWDYKTLEKTRDTHHHHAIDASIIASFPILKNFDKVVKLIDVDKETGEILKDREAVKIAKEQELLVQMPVVTNEIYEKEFRDLYNSPLFKQVTDANDITNPDNPVKFSHKVNKKANRAVANQTIYSAQTFENIQRSLTENDEVIERREVQTLILDKISDIYAYDISGPKVAGYKKFKELYDKEIESKVLPESSIFLMRRNDIKTFEKLEQIMKDYSEFEEISQSDGKVKKINVSPFELYRREHDYITKYTRKDNGLLGNGAPIKSLKFYSSAVFIEDKKAEQPEKSKGKLDITPKNARVGKRVFLDSLELWRTDLYFNVEKDKYEFLFLRQSDLKQAPHNKITIPNDVYDYRKRACKVSDNSEFIMSLYRGEQIELSFKKDFSKQRHKFLFWSGGSDSSGQKWELKPVAKSQFIKGEPEPIYGMDEEGNNIKLFTVNGQWLVAMSGFSDIRKINTDILGTSYYVNKEKLKLDI